MADGPAAPASAALPEVTAAAAAPADASGAAGLPLCPGSDLHERGDAVVFDVRLWGQPARAFALRVDGQVRAYVNRCVHVPVEMDWLPGRFLDADRRLIVCSIHGATYDPTDGHCVGGPCGRGRLLAVATREQGGWVHWYPSRDVTAPAVAMPPAGPSPPAGATDLADPAA